MRGETSDGRCPRQLLLISIHSPHAGRDGAFGSEYACLSYFNPLSPCGERLIPDRRHLLRALFQSTLPVWGETGVDYLRRVLEKISIHSPRVGRDQYYTDSIYRYRHFNPLSPCGERRRSITSATCENLHFNPLSPCGERPVVCGKGCLRHPYFNPLSPCGERLQHERDTGYIHYISIHSPRVGRDL